MPLHQRFKSFTFLHHIVSSTGSPQDADTFWYITFGSLLGNHILFSASTNKTSLLIGCSKIREVKLDPFLLINNFTLRTMLFLSLLISKICPIGQNYCGLYYTCELDCPTKFLMISYIYIPLFQYKVALGVDFHSPLQRVHFWLVWPWGMESTLGL